MRFTTVFILLLQLYNVDMTFQNNFDTINFNLLESFDIFLNKFLIFYPLAPLKRPKSTPIFASDIIFIDIGREMVALLFHLFCGTVLHLLQYKAGQISLISLDFIEILSFLIPFEPLRESHMRSQTVFILLLQL